MKWVLLAVVGVAVAIYGLSLVVNPLVSIAPGSKIYHLKTCVHRKQLSNVSTYRLWAAEEAGYFSCKEEERVKALQRLDELRDKEADIAQLRKEAAELRETLKLGEQHISELELQLWALRSVKDKERNAYQAAEQASPLTTSYVTDHQQRMARGEQAEAYYKNELSSFRENHEKIKALLEATEYMIEMREKELAKATP